MSPEFSPPEFGAAWQKFIEYVNSQAPPPEPPGPILADRILGFLGAEAASLTLLKERLLERELPNLQMAFDHYLTGPERYAEQVGFLAEHEHPTFGLPTILAKQRWQRITERPVQYRSVALAGDERMQCMERGLYFVTDHGARLVVYLGIGEHYQLGVTLELACLDRERAEAFMAEIRRLMVEHNVYRGHVISLGAKGPEDIAFHNLPPIERENIILPPSLLEAVERNTLGFAAHAPRLRAAGRHVKRGLLFHGPPGTGKTLTIMYLISQMRGRTAILLTGRVMGLIRQSCQLARLLAPSVVVLEDVDLVARERDPEEQTGPVLFELLNEMDGLAPEADVLFLLSTNRPDLLEPALAARPGRIDQAIEFPLPDADCRRRLFALYGQGLSLAAGNLEDMVRRTEGASPAFIRELLRKAALIAAAGTRRVAPEALALPSLTDDHLREALRAIIAEGGELTKRLLGVAPGGLEEG